MITLSHSKRLAYECPAYFHMKYIARDAHRKEIFLEEGTFLHEVVQVYIHQLVKHRLNSDSDLLETVFSELWKAQTIIPESYYDSLHEVIQRFGERFVIDPARVLGTEVGIAFDENLNLIEYPNLHSYEEEDKWAEENGVWVHQRLDLVELSGCEADITDWKSARAVTSRADLESRGQGKQYAWALMQANPAIELVRITFDFIRFLNARATLEYTRESVAGVPQMLKTFSEKLAQKDPHNADDWPAQQGVMCALCTYPCPLNDASLEIPRVVRDLDEAIRLAQKAQALKREAKDIEERLKVWTKQREPVDIGLGAYGHNTSTSTPIKASLFVDLCLQTGISMDALLSVNKDKLNKDRLTWELEIQEKLAEIEVKSGKPTASSRFGFKKAEKVKKAVAELVPAGEDEGAE